MSVAPLDHADARLLASRTSEAALSKEEERDLALHLVTCADCKGFYDNLARARSALRRATPTRPPAACVERAVHRSTTVLRGDADPGPRSRPPAEAPVHPGFDGHDEDTGPMQAIDVEAHPEPPPLVIPPPPDPEPEPSPTEYEELPDLELPDLEPAPPAQVWDPGAEATGPTPRMLPEEEPEPPSWLSDPAPEPIHTPPQVVDSGGPIAEPAPLYAPEPDPDRPEPRRRSFAPWLVAIAATLAVAVGAGILVTSRSGVLNGEQSDLPTAERVRERVTSVFSDLTSLRATYSISRLGLYRFRQEDDRIVYSFSNGELSGRLLFEEPERLREERTLQVTDAPAVRTVTVRTPEEIRVLQDEATLHVTANYPFGPASGELRPRLGVLEEAVAVPASLLAAADDLRVLERVSFGEQDVFRVAFSVPPNEFTRADRLDLWVDAITFMPLRVRRTIARSDAGVLGPGDVLGPDALDRAFAGRDRITTELVELSDVSLGDVILPGEFVLDPPPDAQVEQQDASFARVTLAELAGELPFEPLVPQAPPEGLREEAFTVLDGEPGNWGPGDAYPAPTGIAQIVYTDGSTTYVVEQRKMPEGPFPIDGTPLIGTGLPVTSRTVVRAGTQWTYAVSPELPPHVWGFVGDMFVIVSGHAPQADLVRVASAIASAGTLSPGLEATLEPESTP